MNRQFWLRNRPLPPAADSENCAHVRPLLSLMSDGMASAKEAREAQAHLQACADCRQALVWIEATRQAIAARPVVLPPADMRARIACAIAASAETAVPAVPVAMPSVRRTFARRPAYAAAASLALAGAFLGHYFLTSGHAPDSSAFMPPVHISSARSGQMGTETASKPGKSNNAPAPVSRKQPLVVATVPQGVSPQAATAHGDASQPVRPRVLFPIPQTRPLFSPAPGMTAKLPAQSASPGFASKPRPAQVASGRSPGVAPAPAIAPRRSEMIASRPASKSPASVTAHVGGPGPLMAALPTGHADTHAAPGPALVSPAPLPRPISVSPTQVARLSDASSAPVRAVPGDALGGIRTSLASYRSEGYAHRLSMASGVRMRENYVQIPITYTGDNPAARRRPALALRPAAAQAIPQTAPVSPVSALTSSDQRRSERDKQWSDAPATGGA